MRFLWYRFNKLYIIFSIKNNRIFFLLNLKESIVFYFCTVNCSRWDEWSDWDDSICRDEDCDQQRPPFDAVSYHFEHRCVDQRSLKIIYYISYDFIRFIYHIEFVIVNIFGYLTQTLAVSLCEYHGP